MKNTNIFATTMMLGLSSCSNSVQQNTQPILPVSQVYLYGEVHGVQTILDKEFALWNEYYQNQGMRHLFVELAYYTTEFLNQWMQSDNDDILDEVFRDFTGTQMDNPDVKEFYKKIRNQFPETIFHGTDVGHQYGTTGQRFLKYLEDNKLKNLEQYLLTLESIEQGKYYYEYFDDVYRENKMAENFIKEFDKIRHESIMGIYGNAHTGLTEMDYSTNTVLNMANQLSKHYGDIIHSEDLTKYPYRVDTIQINEIDYEAAYFGKQDLSNIIEEYAYREFWRLENAYDDFKDNQKTQDVLSYNNYPMNIEIGQVFVIDYIKINNSVERKYYRSDGGTCNSQPATQKFTLE